MVYQYQSLREHLDEIRLITILPEDKDDPASQIHCRLEKVHLNDQFHTPGYQNYLTLKNEPQAGLTTPGWKLASQQNRQQEFKDWIYVPAQGDDATSQLPEFRYTWGDYMALSYTWDDPTDTREIMINGHATTVTANVEACLRILRDKPYIRAGWKIWMDVLCINQKDIVERANQVKRMREIYGRAWTPIIWLGSETDDSSSALDLIRTLSEKYSTDDAVNELTHDLHQDPEFFGIGRWRALYKLATRRYWRRLWILQEAALGRKDMPVLCGQQAISWHYVSRAFWLLNKTDEVINTYICGELKEAGIEFDLALWTNLYTIGEIQVLQDTQLGCRRTNLNRTLNLGRNVLATDPRDKVYGFLAMMDDSLVDLVDPDYTASVTKVYTDFAKDTIRDRGSLDIVRHRFPSENYDLPTWVPDWTIEPSTSPLTLSNTSFAATGSSTASVSYLNSDRLLSCKGFLIDRFDGMGCMWESGWSPSSVVPATGTVDPYGSKAAVRRAIWTAMVAGRNLYAEPLTTKDDYSSLLATPALSEMSLADESPLRELVKSNVFDWCVSFLQGNAALHVCGKPLREYLDGAADVRPEDVDPRLLRDALMQRDRINVRRRLVTTSRGYVGMVLERVARSDVVGCLLGCSMPMVLRPVDQGREFEIVGECYIHGIMDGEAMQWVERGEVEVEDFVIR